MSGWNAIILIITIIHLLLRINQHYQKWHEDEFSKTESEILLLYCHVTNNTGFWIWWLSLLALPLQLHLIVIAHTLNYLQTSAWRISLKNLLNSVRVWVLCYNRLSVGQCLGIKHPSGAYDQILITVRQLRVCWCWAPSLTRGRICRLQLLLVLASAFSGLSPVALATIFYWHRFETSLFRRLPRLAGLRWRCSIPPSFYKCQGTE
jgi:hypothetical protein